MKCYVAARVDKKEMVQKIHGVLKLSGYEIADDWTTHAVMKPYENNIAASTDFAIRDLNSASTSDLFILITDEHGAGMYTELGVAIASFIEHGRPKIYVIGDYTNRSMFFFHPAVQRRATFEEVLLEI